MEGKAKYIFPALLSGVMAFLMTAVITFINLGMPPDFVARWLRAFLIAWPLAYCAALIAAPIARRGTALIVARLEGRKS
ncbi:DUF2798 domain-containing protein [Rhabdaerophilum calidifontis]|jgi:hypothetical protein|uniref:DUF2798 domain-containing protein n=1 Tax=Rhabdaerophilum calidifontis TaxID=2604328 RepID=UPI00123A8445|nr:DUF2798 domain-containing protein [Rhabdaerophilum calidifontis]